MADVLSLSEVESLLSVLDSSSQSSDSAAQCAGGDSQMTRPQRVSPEQMRAIQALHVGFSRELATGLSAIMRAACDVQIVSVEQLTYSDFILSLGVPTCFNLIESKGLGGHLILDLNPSIVFPFLDRMLGGDQQTTPRACPQRPLTVIESKLMSRVTDLALKAVENAWANVCELQLRGRTPTVWQ